MQLVRPVVCAGQNETPLPLPERSGRQSKLVQRPIAAIRSPRPTVRIHTPPQSCHLNTPAALSH